jgi:hypothetical protein
MKSKWNIIISKFGRTVIAFTLASSLCLVGAGTAFADPVDPYWKAPDQTTPDPNLLTTYGVRAGSAGPDFLGISNTNFDFTGGSASSNAQYPVPANDLDTVVGAGLAIWSTPFNEYPNPYYQNMYYDAVTPDTLTQATTWMSNPMASWGDSNFTTSYKGNDPTTGAATIAGLEFDPDIIWGANKVTAWNLLPDGTNSDTIISAYFANYPWLNFHPTWTSNDATNIWGQVYSIGRLATVADTLTTGTSKETRYDSSNATTSAINYEKAIRGNMLYIASQIDTGQVKEKTVAYLYSIDENDVGYFFTPETTGLLVGDDTGKAPTYVGTPDGNYAANNATIDMGYMATLPFITNTYDSGTSLAGGIIMGVEDIFKINPACTVAAVDATALEDVNVIIYNTTTLRGDALIGEQQGKNDSGIDINTSYDSTYVAAWASSHGFNGTLIAGDDFFTSPNQGYGTVDATANGMSPLLYCQRNYTADKNAKAAWAFAQVYPELYDNNPDATYGYWVDKIYHINTDNVPLVATYMTNKSISVNYDQDTADFLEDCFSDGRAWWGSLDPDNPDDAEWLQFAYYTGSTRASYYSDNDDSEEPASTIGIFAPSSLWTK